MNPAAFLVMNEASRPGSQLSPLPLAAALILKGNFHSALCFLLINYHAASLVIGQRSWMIKVASVHPNAGD